MKRHLRFRTRIRESNHCLFNRSSAWLVCLLLISQCFSSCARSDYNNLHSQGGTTPQNTLSDLESKMNQVVNLDGVAGYLNNKGSYPCIWILVDGSSVPLAISKWPDDLVGRQITVSGKVTLYTVPPALEDAQIRAASSDKDVILDDVHLSDGRDLTNWERKAEVEDPFGKR